MSVRDSAAFTVGRWGEDEVRAHLAAQPGYFVIPVNMIEAGGAPAAANCIKRLVLPDLGLLASGAGQWWEVKTKRHAVKNQRRGQYVHGVARRLWKQYLEVEELSGWTGYLAIVTLEPPQLVAATFRSLAANVVPHQGSVEAFGEPMVWFDLELFEVLLDGPTWRQPAPPMLPITVVHPWPDPPPPEFRQMRLL